MSINTQQNIDKDNNTAIYIYLINKHLLCAHKQPNNENNHNQKRHQHNTHNTHTTHIQQHKTKQKQLQTHTIIRTTKTNTQK